MKTNWFRKLWSAFTRPMYRLEFTLLVFGIVLFQYIWFYDESAFYSMFRKDWRMKLLFYFYAPLLLIFSFIRVPEIFERLWRIAAFTCTLFGAITIEVAVFEAVHRPTGFDLIYHAIVLLQMCILVWFLIKSLRNKFDLGHGLQMDLAPDWVANIVVLVWVVSSTLVFSQFVGEKMYLAAEYSMLGGSIILWTTQKLFRKKVAE